MAETTNLGLKTYDNPSTNENPVDIENNWNANWEKVDEAYGNLNKNKVEKEKGKGLSTNDFTNADKEKLDGLNNYDDTEIKEEISDIQEEQKIQNEDIKTLKAEKEALEKEVESLREDAKLNSLTEDNEGELINITNSTGSRFNALEIEGNEKQDTREGYNTFNVLGLSIENQDAGVTITRNEDGSITANGTPSRAWAVFLRDDKTGDKLEDGQTYTLWQENYSDVQYGGIYLQVIAKPIAGGTNTYIEASTQKKTFKVDKSKYTYQSCIQISTLEAAGVFENYKNRYMIYKGTDDKEFELYGAMPSFDYSSKIRAVGDNVNLFDKNSITADKYINGTHTSAINDYGDLVDSTATNTSDFMPVIKDQNYVFHFEYENLVSTKTRGYCFYNKEKQLIESDAETTYNPKNGKIQVSAKQDGYIRISYDKNCTNIKFEQGEKATSYSNYGQGNISLKILNKNFLDTPKNLIVEKNGLAVTTNENGILTLNGTTTANTYIGLNKDNLLKQEAYTFEQSMFRKGNYKFSVENLSNNQTLNIGAYIRKTYNTGNMAEIYNILASKTKNVNCSIEQDTKAIVYVWIARGITLNNVKLKFQIELAESASDIVTNEQQEYIIPVQQRMFSGDKFVKINGVWKEMHTMGTLYSKDVSVGVGNATSSVEGFYRYSVNFGQLGRKAGSYIKILSNYFKYDDSRWNTKEGICGWETGQIFCIGTYNKNYDTADKLKEFLTENNVEFDYALAKPIYLDCTSEQVEILNKIEQEAHTYSEITNIYTEDEVGAVLKTNTAVDLKSVINNVVEAQLEQIGG